MDGSQYLLDAFSARWGVLTWGSAVNVKGLLRETLRRSTAQRASPADPNVVESMMYGCRVQGGRGDDFLPHLGHHAGALRTPAGGARLRRGVLRGLHGG